MTPGNAGQSQLVSKIIVIKMGPPLPLLRLFSVFSYKQYNFYNKYMWKMSTQYTVQGIEPTTFGIRVSFHNH